MHTGQTFLSQDSQNAGHMGLDSNLHVTRGSADRTSQSPWEYRSNLPEPVGVWIETKRRAAEAPGHSGAASPGFSRPLHTGEEQRITSGTAGSELQISVELVCA